MVVFKHIDLLYKTMNLYTNALLKNFASHFGALVAVQLWQVPKFDPVLHTRVATMKWLCCTSVTCNEIITFFRNSSFSKAYFLELDILSLMDQSPLLSETHF